MNWINALKKSDYIFEFRSLYCACVPLCYVASGNFDFCIHYAGLSIWDIIAPKLIVEEAGGICEVKKYKGEKYNSIAGSRETVELIKKIISNDEKKFI